MHRCKIGHAGQGRKWESMTTKQFESGSLAFAISAYGWDSGSPSAKLFGLSCSGTT